MRVGRFRGAREFFDDGAASSLKGQAMAASVKCPAGQGKPARQLRNPINKNRRYLRLPL
jgi:hypothetical protein